MNKASRQGSYIINGNDETHMRITFQLVEESYGQHELDACERLSESVACLPPRPVHRRTIICIQPIDFIAVLGLVSVVVCRMTCHGH